MQNTTWTTLIERVKQGETTEADARVLTQVRQAVEALDGTYPGADYYSSIGRLLALNARLNSSSEAVA